MPTQTPMPTSTPGGGQYGPQGLENSMLSALQRNLQNLQDNTEFMDKMEYDSLRARNLQKMQNVSFLLNCR